MTDGHFVFKTISFNAIKNARTIEKLKISVSCCGSKTKQDDGKILINIKDEGQTGYSAYIVFIITSNTTTNNVPFQKIDAQQFPFDKNDLDGFLPATIQNPADKLFNSAHKGSVVAGYGTHDFHLAPITRTLKGPRRYYMGLILLDIEKNSSFYISTEVFDYNKSKTMNEKDKKTDAKKKKTDKEKNTKKESPKKESKTIPTKESPKKDKKRKKDVIENNVVQETKNDTLVEESDVTNENNTPNINDTNMDEKHIQEDAEKQDHTKKQKLSKCTFLDVHDKIIALVRRLYDSDELKNPKVHNQDTVHHICCFIATISGIDEMLCSKQNLNLLVTMCKGIQKCIAHGIPEEKIFKTFHDYIKSESSYADDLCRRKHSMYYSMDDDITLINEMSKNYQAIF